MLAQDSEITPPPLTALSADEKLFQSTVRKFAREQIRPYVREMDEDELRQAGSLEPTIDRIEVVEFESQEEQREWLAKHAPAFLRH